MSIPAVKQWIVTTVDGERREVLAPTKLLAKLAYRRDWGFGAIRSIGLARFTRDNNNQTTH